MRLNIHPATRYINRSCRSGIHRALSGKRVLPKHEPYAARHLPRVRQLPDALEQPLHVLREKKKVVPKTKENSQGFVRVGSLLAGRVGSSQVRATRTDPRDLKTCWSDPTRPDQIQPNPTRPDPTGPDRPDPARSDSTRPWPYPQPRPM